MRACIYTRPAIIQVNMVRSKRILNVQKFYANIILIIDQCASHICMHAHANTHTNTHITIQSMEGKV